MSIWTLTVSGDREGAVMFYHVEGYVFGPVFEDVEECERFQHWYYNVGDPIADRFHQFPLYRLESDTLQRLLLHFRKLEETNGAFVLP